MQSFQVTVDFLSRLARYDLVVTTYGTVMSEMKPVLAKNDEKLEDLKAVDLGKDVGEPNIRNLIQSALDIPTLIAI